MLEGAYYNLLSRIDKLSSRLIDKDLDLDLDPAFVTRTHDLLGSLKLRVLKEVNEGLLAEPMLSSFYLRTYRLLNDECTELEIHRCLVIRQYGTPERYLNRLIHRIYKEIAFVGYRRIPLLTTTTAPQNYYWVHPKHDIIGVPPGEEDNLLHLPDLYHEIGHIVFMQAQVTPSYNWITGNFARELQAHFDDAIFDSQENQWPESYQYKLVTWKEMWLNQTEYKWLEELVCDLIATYLVGPAYAWTHLKLVMSEGKTTYDLYGTESADHPADEARFRAIRFMLFETGQGADVYVLDQAWGLMLGEYRKPDYYENAYPNILLERLAQTVCVSCREQALQSYSDQLLQSVPPVSLLLNEAWQRVHFRPNDFGEWERDAIQSLRDSFNP